MRKRKRQAILLNLIEALSTGSWCGETHVQKATYFLQHGVGVPLEFEFVLYKHGPFSFDLRQELGEMRGASLIEVLPRPLPYGPSLSLGPSAAALVKVYPKTLKKYLKQVEAVADFFKQKYAVDVERLGTALYVTREWPKLSSEERASKIVELKPHITESDAQKAVAVVDKLLRTAPIAS
jgi:hypothetical protein